MTVDPNSVKAFGREFDDEEDGETAVGDELVARLGNDDACERTFSASSSCIEWSTSWSGRPLGLGSIIDSTH